ncbi:type-1 angiotensin II receptor-associated protein [Ascaphus truei]|uniref:type-1 angiotensin II receptor-associated protein n=1 Tax=Ascaphus truei TaxID=8439 RepID=UPI003F5A04C4
MELPAVNLKAIVLAHWLLTVWACTANWLPSAYVWGNLTVLAVGIWAIAQRDSVDAIIMFLIGLMLTVITDIILFSLYFAAAEASVASSPLRDLFRFSAGMAILSLILKPLSCFFVYHMYRERGGEYNVNLGFLTVARDRNAYQSIDHLDVPTEQENKVPARSY